MKHVIIGAGPAGISAAECLRKLDLKAAVTVVGDEPGPPYSRMAIPYLLAGNIDEEGTCLRHNPGHYQERDIHLQKGKICAVDPGAGCVELASGQRLDYDRLLVASGSHTVKPPIAGMELAQVQNCWTLEDARRIAARANPGARVVLMGAGFIGCIVLEALAARRVNLTVIETADRMLPRMMDETGGAMIKNWCEAKGVSVLTATTVTGIQSAAEHVELSLSNGGTLAADLVVCATGVKPNVDFLQGSGVAIGEGILVDHHLQTSVEHIYAAGDVAQGPDLSTGKQAVHAIQPTASEHGRVAALGMSGRSSGFRGSLSMNVLNTLGLVSSSFGLWMGVAGGDRVVAVDQDACRYLRLEFEGSKLVGALALGLTRHVGVIRGLIQTGVPLGSWKDALKADPLKVMHAYLEQIQGGAQLQIQGRNGA